MDPNQNNDQGQNPGMPADDSTGGDTNPTPTPAGSDMPEPTETPSDGGMGGDSNPPTAGDNPGGSPASDEGGMGGDSNGSPTA